MKLDASLYDMIFKRKSFHLFRNLNTKEMSAIEVDAIEHKFNSLIPLNPEIKTGIRVVPTSETSCKRGQQFCIMLYSEKKDNYLQNIGYLGEQLDLYLVSQNIATLWYGIGKPDKQFHDGLDFVIMILISKIDDETKFRKDMFKSKRKPLEEIWTGKPIDGVAEIIRFAPSSCNTQPWIVNRDGDKLEVYRYKKPGKRGIMPVRMVTYFNQIDIGIFLCFMDMCLQHNGIKYEVKLHTDSGIDDERILVAEYEVEG